MLNPFSTEFIADLVLIAAAAPSLLAAVAQLSASGRVVRAGAAASQQRVFAAVRLRGAAESEEEEEEAPVPLSYMEFVANADLTKVEVLKAQAIEFIKPMLEYLARVFEIELNPMMLRMQAGSTPRTTFRARPR
jgi:hypothetical protein